MPDTILFDHAKYEALKKAYAIAEKNGADQFEFEGKRLVTAYAKYLLQYVSTKFGDKPHV